LHSTGGVGGSSDVPVGVLKSVEAFVECAVSIRVSVTKHEVVDVA
jgi:hypothetical protein